MKKPNKMITLLLALGISTSSMAFADSDIMLISTNTNIEMASIENPITIDNVTLNRSYITDSDGKKFLPVKVIAEALGYQVKWFGEDRHVELIKGAQFITMKTTENYFTFSKMAPMKLSDSAFIENGSTYVPVDFVNEILRGNLYENDGKLEITSDIDKNVSTGGFIITKIEDQMIYATLSGGEAHIMLNKETTILDHKTGLAIGLSDLAIGDTLKVTHPSIMLMIYPPQYSAFEIERINEIAYTEGTIDSIQEHSILVNTNSNLIQFNIDDQTKISGLNESELDLSALRIGNSVKIYHSLAMTKSIPPQSYANEILVDTAIK